MQAVLQHHCAVAVLLCLYLLTLVLSSPAGRWRLTQAVLDLLLLTPACAVAAAYPRAMVCLKSFWLVNQGWCSSTDNLPVCSVLQHVDCPRASAVGNPPLRRPKPAASILAARHCWPSCV